MAAQVADAVRGRGVSAVEALADLVVRGNVSFPRVLTISTRVTAGGLGAVGMLAPS